MNSIKTYLNSLGRATRTTILALAVVFVSAGIAQAATTISTSILTNGTLGATGVSTFGATASTTISAAGLLVTPGATVNGTLDVIGISTFGATASTTISAAGAVSMPSTLSVTGLSSLSFASSTLFSANSAYFGSSATSTFSSAGALTLVAALSGTSGSFSTTLGVTGATTLQELTQGGGQCTITDANGGAYVLTQAELAACNYLYMTASVAGQAVIALTLPATSTMTTLLANVGDTREWLIDASDLAVATTTTITAGTGVDMLAVTTAEDVIDGGEYSELRCWRKSDTDVACITSELVDSD